MPTTVHEVGTLFVVQDKATPVIEKIAKAVFDLGENVTAVQAKLAKLGTFRFTGITRNVKKLDDQFAALAATADSTIRNMTTATDAAGVSARTLAAQWRTVQAAASQAAAATQGASRIRVASGGGTGRGNGNGGFGIRGPSGTHLGGGFHAHSGSLIGQGLMAALGYGIVEQSKLEDFSYRATFTAGVPASQMAAIQKAIKTAASQTGASIPDLGEAALDEIRQLGGTGLSWQQKLNVLGPLLTYGAAEGRLKGTSAKEGVDSIIGLAHMLKVYDPKKIAALADKFAFLSTVNPAKLQQMERAAGYAVPMLGELGFDPFQVLSLQTAMMRGGILNTKSGTWLRQLGVRALPGTSVMSRQAFMKHESALAALGLIDSKNDPTWFTNGAPDLVKLLEMASKHLQAMPIAQRAGVMQQLFGAQGSGAAAFLSDPKILKMLPALEADMNRFRSGSALFKNYALNSPTQQFDQAWANLRNVLMDISTVVLPPLTGALQHFDDMLKVLQKILPSSDGAFGKAIGESYGRGLATGNPVEALGGAAWGALKYWWGSSDDQKKATKQGAEEGAKKGVEDGLKHKTSFFGSALGGPVLIPASYSTGGAAYGNGVYYGGGIPGGLGGGGGNFNPGGPVTTNPGARSGIANPGVNPMGSAIPMQSYGAGHVNFMHGQFGAPGTNIVGVTAGGKHFRVNKYSAGAISGFVNDLAAAGAPINSIGGFNNRNIAGSSRKSQHAYGNAIDIDQHARNIVDPGLRAWAQSHPTQFRSILNKWGMISGGDWRHPDFGHFEWSGHLPAGTAAAAHGVGSLAGLHGNAYIKAARSGFAKELTDPQKRLQFAAMLLSEGNPTQTAESAMNRSSFQHKSLMQALRSGFYGPINRGQLPAFMRRLRNNPKLMAKMNASIDAALAGSDTIKGATDQGMVSDPNGRYILNHFHVWGKGHGNIYGDWNGGRGTERWRHDFESHASESPSDAIASGGGQNVTINHTTKLDGRTIAKSTSKHQARMGNKPSHSSRMSDPYGTSLLSI
jgi:hypothetical protein